MPTEEHGAGMWLYPLPFPHSRPLGVAASRAGITTPSLPRKFGIPAPPVGLPIPGAGRAVGRGWALLPLLTTETMAFQSWGWQGGRRLVFELCRQRDQPGWLCRGPERSCRLPTPLPEPAAPGAVSSHDGPQWTRPSPAQGAFIPWDGDREKPGARRCCARIPRLRCLGVWFYGQPAKGAGTPGVGTAFPPSPALPGVGDFVTWSLLSHESPRRN